MTQEELYLKTLGEIIVEFNRLEASMEFNIWAYLFGGRNAQNFGRRVTYELKFIQKLDLLQGCVFEREGEEVANEFKKNLYGRIENIMKKRNDYVHSTWFIEYGVPDSLREDERITTKINFKHAAKGNSRRPWNYIAAEKKVTIDDLKKFLKEIQCVNGKIMAWLHKDMRNMEPVICK